MPCVGMRRTTRVFGVVKAADGARVLRSGRRIWPNVDEPKLKRAHDLVDRDWKVNNGACCLRGISTEKDNKEEDFPVIKRRRVRTEAVGDDKTVDKLFGIVYSRKRKSLSDQSSLAVHPSVRASKLTRGSLGFHSIRKRRSSLRRRRARNLSHSVHKLRSSSPDSSGISVIPKPLTKQELDSLCCSVNILVIGSDRCTREEGCSAVLEFLSSKEWFIVIKKDGVIRYSFKARKTMRPCLCNRFTRSIVWVGDNNWKLEFCEREDWLGFKEIYKECYERNVLERNAKVIPIPGVREVCGYGEDVPSFSMPVPYISVKEDEVSRAMARNFASYDMDSEDEEWLERQKEEKLEQDTFELMIDGFEKSCFHSPADVLLDEKAATIASLSYLGRQDVVEAVYDYWARKRKQRKAPLLRVFQGHQAKKTPLLFKPVIRKRRSFKRQGSQLHGKSKQPRLVSLKAAEQEAWEEQNVFLRVEEAKALVDASIEIAMAKRRRAQVVAENADLAVYKAMMALRIAQAMKVADSRSYLATSLLLN